MDVLVYDQEGFWIAFSYPFVKILIWPSDFGSYCWDTISACDIVIRIATDPLAHNLRRISKLKAIRKLSVLDYLINDWHHKRGPLLDVIWISTIEGPDKSSSVWVEIHNESNLRFDRCNKSAHRLCFLFTERCKASVEFGAPIIGFFVFFLIELPINTIVTVQIHTLSYAKATRIFKIGFITHILSLNRNSFIRHQHWIITSFMIAFY